MTVDTIGATELVFLEVGSMDTPESAPRKHVLTDVMAVCDDRYAGLSRPTSSGIA
jgi:hypothetical protein